MNYSHLCDTCGRELKTKSSLYRHIRNVHKQQCSFRSAKYDQRFACLKCKNVSFAVKNSLYRHNARRHKPESTYICAVCNTNFTRRKNMISHLKTHSNEMTENSRSPSMETLSNIGIILPEDRKYEIIKLRTSGSFLVKLQFYIEESQDAIKYWIQHFEEKNKIFLRSRFAKPSNKDFIIFKKAFRCGHNIKTKRNKISRSSRQTGCGFRLLVCVSKRDSRCVAQVRIGGKHNHVRGCASFLKFRPVSSEVREKMLLLFHNGCTPAKAYRQHLRDLQEEYDTNFFRVREDRSICPDIKWIYRFHNSIFKKEYSEAYDINVLQFLQEETDEYDAEERRAVISIIDENDSQLIPQRSEQPLEQSIVQQPEPLLNVGRPDILPQNSASFADTEEDHHEDDSDSTTAKFRNMCDDIISRVHNGSATSALKTSLLKMVHNYEKIRTESALQSALTTFGLYNSLP